MKISAYSNHRAHQLAFDVHNWPSVPSADAVFFSDMGDKFPNHDLNLIRGQNKEVARIVDSAGDRQPSFIDAKQESLRLFFVTATRFPAKRVSKASEPAQGVETGSMASENGPVDWNCLFASQSGSMRSNNRGVYSIGNQEFADVLNLKPWEGKING